METFKVSAKTLHIPENALVGEELFVFYFNGITTLEKTEELVTHVPRFDENYFSKYEIIEYLEGIELNTKNKLNGKKITYFFLTDKKNT
jgi:hypothetical protein